MGLTPWKRTGGLHSVNGYIKTNHGLDEMTMIRMWLGGFVIAGLASVACAERHPNIIVIMADDLGWTDVSTGRTNLGNGSDFYETPNIDRLAREGLAFTACRMQPNCAPTRAALLSGQYAARSGNGVYNVASLNRGSRKASKNPANRPEYSHAASRLIPPSQVQDVPSSTITVAEALKDNGYVTAHFGKYHVGGHSPGTLPEDQGFDHNFAGCAVGHQKSCFPKETESGWSFRSRVGRPELDPYAQPYSAEYLRENGLPKSLESTPKHITDAMGDALLDFIRTHRRGPNRERPFYAQFHTYAVHGPHMPRADLKAHYKGKKPGKRHSTVNYAGFVQGLDQTVGRLIRYLKDPNGDGDPSDSIAEKTIVLFTSDNGGSHGTSNVPLRRNKGTFYGGGLRVPLIAWQPGVVPAGKVSDTLIHAVDFYPTLVDLAGGKRPDPRQHHLDGESFVSVLRGEAQSRPRTRPICYYFPGYMDNRAWPLAVTIQEIDQQRYKFLYSYETGFAELYNLSRDIGETKNLLAEEYLAEHKSLANRMIRRLNAWLVRDDPTWNPARMTDKSNGKLVPVGVPEITDSHECLRERKQTSITPSHVLPNAEHTQ